MTLFLSNNKNFIKIEDLFSMQGMTHGIADNHLFIDDTRVTRYSRRVDQRSSWNFTAMRPWNCVGVTGGYGDGGKQFRSRSISQKCSSSLFAVVATRRNDPTGKLEWRGMIERE